LQACWLASHRCQHTSRRCLQQQLRPRYAERSDVWASGELCHQKLLLLLLLGRLRRQLAPSLLLLLLLQAWLLLYLLVRCSSPAAHAAVAQSCETPLLDPRCS
jgi:hypothetical protein